MNYRITDVQVATAIRAYVNGMSDKEVFKTYGVSPASLYSYLKKLGLPRRYSTYIFKRDWRAIADMVATGVASAGKSEQSSLPKPTIPVLMEEETI